MKSDLQLGMGKSSRIGCTRFNRTQKTVRCRSRSTLSIYLYQKVHTCFSQVRFHNFKSYSRRGTKRRNYQNNKIIIKIGMRLLPLQIASIQEQFPVVWNSSKLLCEWTFGTTQIWAKHAYVLFSRLTHWNLPSNCFQTWLQRLIYKWSRIDFVSFVENEVFFRNQMHNSHFFNIIQCKVLTQALEIQLITAAWDAGIAEIICTNGYFVICFE